MLSASPFTLQGLQLKNRWVLAPMTTYSSQADGTVADDELPYYQSRAEAGFGLVISAACYVHPSGHAFDGQWSCASPEMLGSLTSVANAIHAGGSAAALQIHHGGRQCPGRLCGGMPWSASAVPAERENAEIPHSMSTEETGLIIESFASACALAEQAGWDAVEIHGANTYLLQQFVSPHSNRREDAFGQDRLKFSREIIRACRSACSIPVGYRLSPEEPETPGIRLPDTRALVEMLIAEGVAWMDVSLRDYRQPSLHEPDSGPALGMITEWVSGAIPLMAGGGVKSLADAEACLKLGADLVYVGRAAIAEPQFVQKVTSGEPIRSCIPVKNAAELLTLPKGLEQKIYAVRGWFSVDEE